MLLLLLLLGETTCATDDDFQCFDNHHCVPLRFTCDGEFDCTDHSDELTCSKLCPSTYLPPPIHHPLSPPPLGFDCTDHSDN